MFLNLRNYLVGVTLCSIVTIALLYLVIYHRVEKLQEYSSSPSHYNMENGDEEREFLDYDDYNVQYDDDDTEYEETFLTEEDVERLEGVMEERKQWAEDACERLGEDSDEPPNGWEYLVNYEHQLIWCNVFKAASTTWFNNFMLLTGRTLEDYSDFSPVNAVRLIYHRPTGEELKEAHSADDSIAFIIVRHPFERLSSAYRDKIQNKIMSDSYGELAEEIVEKYRKNIPKQTDKNVLHDSTPTFEEFVRYILDESNKNHTLDMHWIPYSQFCTPCQMNFDIILKMETLEEDQKYLVHKAVLENIITNDVLNDGEEKRVEHGVETKDLLKEHYSQLTKSQIKDLYNLYRYDFEIFNYSMDEYYSMSSDESPALKRLHLHQ